MPLIGAVTARRDAILRLTVHGPAATETLETVVDTGYDGSLLVPVAVASRLGMAVISTIMATLADGTVVRLQVALAEVDWLPARQRVRVEIGPSADVLLGTELLAAHRLVIDYPAAVVEVT